MQPVKKYSLMKTGDSKPDRHLTDIPYTTPTEDTVDFAVIQIPNGHKTVLHQIHGLGAPPYFKLNYTGKDDGTGTLRALCKVSTNATVDTTTTLLTGISNGQRIISRVQYTGTALLFHVNGTLVLNQPMDITIGDYSGRPLPLVYPAYPPKNLDRG